MFGLSCSQRPWHFFNAARLELVSVDMVKSREKNVISSVYPTDSLMALEKIFISFDEENLDSIHLNYTLTILFVGGTFL